MSDYCVKVSLKITAYLCEIFKSITDLTKPELIFFNVELCEKMLFFFKVYKCCKQSTALKK